MTISAVGGQASGAFADNATSVSKAYPGNVTNGNRLLVGAWRWTPSNDAYVAGDCTKSAGTSTIGSVAMDVSINYNYSGVNYISAAVYSAAVIGTGSCTIQTAGAPAGSYLAVAVQEVTSGNGAITLETGGAGVSFNSGQGSTAAPSSGNVTSGGSDQSVMFAVMNTNNGATNSPITPDASFTQVYEVEDGSAHQPGSAQDRIVATGVTDAGNWTLAGSDNWCAVIACYKEPAAGAATSLLPSRRRLMGTLQNFF